MAGSPVLRRLGLALLALLGLFAALIAWLGTESGRGFLLARLLGLEFQSGLTVGIERLDGSLWRRAEIKGFSLGDPNGRFLEAPSLTLEWRPWQLVTRKRLAITELASPRMVLLRAPALRPTDTPLLPDLDILVNRLAIPELVLEPAVLGRREQFSLIGSTDIRAGRARLHLTGDSQGGDRLRVALDAVPDKNRLQLAVDLAAPARGTLATLLDSEAPLTLRLRGQGDWTRWQGRLDARAGDDSLIGLDIGNEKGLFRVAGAVAPAPLLRGTLAALFTPGLRLDATGRLAGGPRELDLRLRSDMFRFSLRGRLAADNAAIETGSLGFDLLVPQQLAPRLVARDLRLEARLAGSLADPLVDWSLTATEAGWGETRLSGVRGGGIIRPRQTADGLALPFSLAAARVIGLPDLAADALQSPRLDGSLVWKEGRLSGDGLRLRAARLAGTADLAYRPATADYRLALRVSAPGQPLPGLGLATLAAELTVRSGAQGPDLRGKASARVTRLDNGGVRSLFGGLPSLDTGFALAPDLSLSLSGLSLRAPDLSLAGSARLSPAADLILDLNGTSRSLGPLALYARGRLPAPELLLRLARPGLGIGLADVALSARPNDSGWGLALDATSRFGPLEARARLLTDTPLTLSLDSAQALGLSASGTASATEAGPFAGRFAITGPGLNGSLALTEASGLQKLALDLRAREASLTGSATPLLLERGDLALTLVLREEGPDATGTFSFLGFESESFRIDKGEASLRYANSSGHASLAASGTSGIPFSLETAARFAGDEIEITGKGQIDRQAITLSNPARLLHDGNDWVLEPVSLVAGQGRAELSGRIGDTTRLKARLERLSLGLIAAAFPRLDFTGTLSGTLNLDLPEGGIPRGRAELSVTSLSRTGLSAASLPINLALNLDLGARGTVARATLSRAGRTEGRAQLSLGPVASGEAPVLERLLAVPIKAMVRYNGPAQALWGLAGNDAIAVSGPISLSADIAGLLGDPQLSGTLAAARTRLEATALGAVIEDAIVEGRFNGSQLTLSRFQGRVGKDGSVSGSGTLDLSAARSFPIDIRLQMKNAQLLNRDDVSGAATGTMRIATDEYGGVVSGQLNIDRATYRLGRAAVADVPVLNVTERNTRLLGRPQLAYAPPTRWLFNLQVKGDRRLFASGMGLEAEWRADLSILGGATTPELNGRVELVRGDYEFAGRRFSLTRGDIRFQGGYPPDPLIDIAAESTNSGFTALLAVNGTALKPNIRFSSVPQLPEDEVLSRLLFGESVTNLSAPEAIQLAGALGSLRGNGGFNPINSVRKGLGIDRLRILPADIATGRGTSVAAGQYIGRNVYVELATDAQGYTATNIEVSITRSLSILSEVATLGGIGGNLRWKRDY